MIRVLHVITGLPVGGAQSMLYKLLSSLDRSEIDSEVVSLLGPDAMMERIERLGVRVRSLHVRPGASVLGATVRLTRWLRAEPPDVVQCWMYHADLVGGVAARLAGTRRVLWGIRQSRPDPRVTKRSTLWVVRACARLSRSIPARIVCCSAAARRDHAAFGYDSSRMVVIPNGFDLGSFRPEAAFREEVRCELGIPESAPLVGLIARYHPQKDHASFLAAAGLVARHLPDTHFLLCGKDVDRQNRQLIERIARERIGGHVHLLGERTDVARLTASLDVACSSSAFAEGFPNTIGEAMACAVPCVATDVGDSAEIVGSTGRVVPAGDSRALADAVSTLLTESLERRRLGQAARERIGARYSLSVVAARYRDLYYEVLSS